MMSGRSNPSANRRVASLSQGTGSMGVRDLLPMASARFARNGMTPRPGPDPPGPADALSLIATEGPPPYQRPYAFQ